MHYPFRRPPIVWNAFNYKSVCAPLPRKKPWAAGKSLTGRSKSDIRRATSRLNSPFISRILRACDR
jgi:hypothetical protein